MESLLFFHSLYSSGIHIAQGLYPASMAVFSSLKNTLYLIYCPFLIHFNAEGQSNFPYILSFLWPPSVPGSIT